LSNPFKKLKEIFTPSETRNAAIASVYQATTPQPIFTKWTIQNAVKQGYKKNSWVYRSVYLKSKAGSSVPWYVINADGDKQENHHLTQLFQHPNPFISRQDLFELVISWLELSGNSYLLKLKAGAKTSELWPVSPDRLKPIPTKDPAKWMEGYALDQSTKANYEPDELIHHKYFNPANPLLGIAPLEAVSKIVDVDNAQVAFNQATSQNRGVIDGVFTFDRNFNDQTETDAIADKLNERHRGKRSFGVLGSNAKYIRTAMTPAEMDFISSRKASREEIFIAFGVPPVYAGVMEAATMNNYRTSELVFWFGTMLFLLDDVQDTFNFSFRDELKPGEKIIYDVSNIPAIREAMIAKSKTAKELFDMGVPFEQLNKIFDFRVEEFDGWEDSHVASGQSTPPAGESSVRSKKKMIFLETRATFDTEKEIEKQTDIYTPILTEFLETQQEAIFDLIGKGETVSVTEAQIIKAIKSTETLLKDIVGDMYMDVAIHFSTQFTIEKRDSDDDIKAIVEEYLRKESIILFEISNINSTTVDGIISQALSAMEAGADANTLQQALIDTGIFSPSRALMLSRTITGTAANLGQISGAINVGATHKTWSTATFEVRKSHQAMNDISIPIDELFVVGGEKAMFPLDNRLTPAQRCNCRCSCNYAIKEE